MRAFQANSATIECADNSSHAQAVRLRTTKESGIGNGGRNRERVRVGCPLQGRQVMLKVMFPEGTERRSFQARVRRPEVEVVGVMAWMPVMTKVEA